MKNINMATVLLVAMTTSTGCTSNDGDIQEIPRTTLNQPTVEEVKEVSFTSVEKVVLKEHDLLLNKVNNQKIKNTKEKRTVIKGTFKSNLEKLARKNGYRYVKWDRRVENCTWQQETSYMIPAFYARTPEEIITFYAKTQDFYPQFSTIDRHVMLNYVGNPSNLLLCNQEG